MLDRSDAIITEDQDKRVEEKNIHKALSNCGYPDWTFNKVKQDRSTPKPKPTRTRKEDSDKSKGSVVIPYVQGVSERVSRVFKKHGFTTAMKPHCTIRSMLVHPKDKLLPEQKSEAIYDIPCADCPKSYIGETGRSFGIRLQEHQTDVEKFETKPYTRSTRTISVTETHRSAITDHVAQTNHSIDWDSSKVIARESDKTTRWIKEAVWIRRKGKDIINKDEGAYKLHHIFDQLITPVAVSTTKQKNVLGCQSEEASSLEVKCN